MTNIWNIRLRGPHGKHVVLKVDSNTNIKMFTDQAVKELGFKANERLIFRRGFPPRVVDVEGSMLVKNVFEANETIIVDTSSDNTVSVQTTSTLSAKNGVKKSKRTAVKKTGVKVPKYGVHTLNEPTSTKKREPLKRKITGGKTRSTGEVPGTKETRDTSDNEDEAQRKHRRGCAINLTSMEDVELSLVNAVSGQSNDRAATFYRAATKNAVEHQYELTLATARLNAALGHNFEMEELTTSRHADGSIAKIRVRFKETSRKWKEEIVDLLKRDELQAIVKYVLLSGGETGREMLKPFNMAQVSTRVFWSIARLYNGDVAAGLVDLVPDEDWSFLDTRTRVMSKKAKEAKTNEEQYTLWKKSCTQGGKSSPQKQMTQQVANNELPAAKKELEVIHENFNVEQEVKKEAAMSMCTQIPAISVKKATSSAVAQAALTRLDKSLQTSVVVSAFLQEKKPTTQFSTKKQVAPADEEEMESEEKMEEAVTVYCDSCKKARILSPEEAANAELDKDPWTCASLVKTGRDGECEAIDDEVAQITGVTIAEWLRKVAITTRRELADATVNSTIHALVNSLDPSAQVLQEKLEMLINEARLDEVNDWMLELVGESDVVRRLEAQKLGTPADLIATPSDLILEAVGNTCSTAYLSVDEVSSWQTRSKNLVDKHPWLADWRTL
ncbi:unnamed protein product [Peronospora belbahrii]|uniref:CW-type domain-containing protein n=1 Tax=Peronospora belbahrii TaxID=622444 RepID=A0ABN8CV81_9STRA|nr:unnamed protein product [Peronospora belbahrii]